jgi:hypothetical protein
MLQVAAGICDMWVSLFGTVLLQVADGICGMWVSLFNTVLLLVLVVCRRVFLIQC